MIGGFNYKVYFWVAILYLIGTFLFMTLGGLELSQGEDRVLGVLDVLLAFILFGMVLLWKIVDSVQAIEARLK